MKTTTAPVRQRPGPRAAARTSCMMAVVLGLTACAQGGFQRIPRGPHAASLATPAARYARELEMNRQWQNKPLAELLVAKGRPRMIMSIPGGGMPPAFAVVYGPDPESGCIDAFAVNTSGDPTVRVYHCR